MAHIYRRNDDNNDERRAAMNISQVSRSEPQFPEKLRDIPSPPRMLYWSGALPDPHKPAIAVIGARTCSEYGRRMARLFGEKLGSAGVQIISGMARGIDGISQMAALQAGGSSYGVLGCGVDICYPKENAELYQLLLKKGGVISEYAPGSQPLPQQFPARNRIIAGLADVLVVIEARQKSGTLITVDMALEQGKEVYVVPGRLDDALSEGCNRLIKQGAELLLSPEELLQERSIDSFKQASTKTENRQKNNFVLDKDENMVYASIDLYAKNLEDIVESSKIPIQEIMHILLSLELKGLIKEVGKNHYVRL